ncbi:MAG: hypothetical protein KA713_21275 [Chryseotalea sp. WA131a]|jgi:hypothetical protein|nr:MAG: hypothetical protein KA713_21275 [Chryseotalea sp. WA131a]
MTSNSKHFIGILICNLLFVLAPSLAFTQIEYTPLKIEIKTLNQYTLKFHKSYYHNLFEQYPKVKVDSIEQQFFKVGIALSNDSHDTLMVWMMSCSWTDDFVTNNKYIKFDVWPCDKNHPTAFVIPPNGKKEFEGLLVKSVKFDLACSDCTYKSVLLETKVGIINNPTKPSGLLKIGSKDQTKRNITWSNPLKFQISVMKN